MLTFSICVLFQTSSKKACETNKNTSNWTTSPSNKGLHQKEKLSQYQKTCNCIEKEVPHKMLVKQQQQTGNLNLTKQRASPEGKTFTLSEENCIKKELWTVLKNIVL